MGIPKFRAIGKTYGACFIKKNAREKTTSNFAHVLHERPVRPQGWQKYKIYPDFIFTATASEKKDDYEQVYVVETKGLHLMGSSDTDYKQKMFSLCTREAKSRSRTELGLEMKDKVLRFEVLAEDEWQAILNEMLQA